jgi:superfamily I DNA/RNA helicase
MLIGELVPQALRYLRDNPAAGVRGFFENVLVDEYQDLNRAEQVFLDHLTDGGSLIVIGDEDQSIYSFKHAHPEGITSFHETHHPTHDESLDLCRRCPPMVVDMANYLIARNRNRAPRSLRSIDHRSPGEVHVVQWRDMEDEARGIARFIRDRIESGETEPGKVLVLAPRRKFGYAIRDALNAVKTPALSFFHEEALDGNPKLPDDCQAAEAFTLLTLLCNPDDRVALRCWCGFGSGSLRSGAWGRLRAHCEATGDSPRMALQALASGALKLPNCKELAARYAALEVRLSQLRDLDGPNLLEGLFPREMEWTEPFRTIALPLRTEDYTAKSLHDALKSAITQPEMPVDVDYVRVMSLHKSKGLTADLVVVVGCVEGALPRRDDALPMDERIRRLEEQRRLFYVAVTRPVRTLVISSFTQLPYKVAHQMHIPVVTGPGANGRTVASQFLQQLGPNCPSAITGTTLLAMQPKNH